MKSRKELGEYLQQFYKTGVGAEIGTYQGEFAETLFETGWRGKIICVDNWSDIMDRYYTEQKTRRFDAALFYGDSLELSKLIADRCLDWIYIDTEHDYESIKRDYYAWYPKVRDGGVISGHDYGDNDFDVKRFVNELGIEFKTTTDDIYGGIEQQTWYFVKNG